MVLVYVELWQNENRIDLSQDPDIVRILFFPTERTCYAGSTVVFSRSPLRVVLLFLEVLQAISDFLLVQQIR